MSENIESKASQDQKKVVIELDNVRRDFLVGDETVHALKGVSFKIYEGEFVTIMGSRDRASLPCSTSWAVSTPHRVANTTSTACRYAPCRVRSVPCCATAR